MEDIEYTCSCIYKIPTYFVDESTGGYTGFLNQSNDDKVIEYKYGNSTNEEKKNNE